MSDLAKLPEGVEMSLQLYFYSPSDDVEVRINLSGLTVLPDSTLPTIDMAAMISTLPPAEDWRPMTRSEIDDYKRRQDDDKA